MLWLRLSYRGQFPLRLLLGLERVCALKNSIYDVQRLRARHAHVAAIADAPAPEARIVAPPTPVVGTPTATDVSLPQGKPSSNVAVIAGSFNPITLAHLSLSGGALQQPDVGAVWLSLAVHTVDKEHITGAFLEDRLCMLETIAESQQSVGVVLCNRGLYVEQAEALRSTVVAPDQELVFVVGYDKIQQILDPRYYEDREASLDRLFSLARFLVAERGAYGAQALAALLSEKTNLAYSGRIAPLTTLPLRHDPALSSTAVRTAYAEGGGSPAEAYAVPETVQAFIAATGVYASPMVLPNGETIDRYGVRMRIRDALLAEPESDFSAAEFRTAVALATTDSDSGSTLRRLLAEDCKSLRAIRKHITV